MNGTDSMKKLIDTTKQMYLVLWYEKQWKAFTKMSIFDFVCRWIWSIIFDKQINVFPIYCNRLRTIINQMFCNMQSKMFSTKSVTLLHIWFMPIHISMASFLSLKLMHESRWICYTPIPKFGWILHM